MNLAGIAWAWAQSHVVAGAGGVRALRRRLAFVRAAARVQDALASLRTPPAGSALQRALQQRPQLVGAVVWPYVCAEWPAERRLQHLAAHFQAVGRLPVLDVAVDAEFELLGLGDLSPGLRMVLDQPAWFMREGPLVLNLFEGETRLYSLAFSLGTVDGRPAAYVGAVQGVTIDGVLERYRDLTKVLHGLRPRDFLVEVFRMLCCGIGVKDILAVADASRVHRSAYFGAAKASALQVDYDEIWRDRGGAVHDAQFFALPVEAPARDLAQVPSKKRALYRRRYELLAALEAQVSAACVVRAGPRPSEVAVPAPGFEHVAQHA